ncbi:MAG: hypothetical protein L6R41_006259 [Letrouitia leprolyta]|nr:MAG: hypothetical protein L6R41_006259 [Letrouitia leprolyta]
MFFLALLLYAVSFTLLTSALVPPPAAPGTDACGPFDHTGDAGFSTCKTPVAGSSGPAPYGIICGRDPSIKPRTKIEWCANSAVTMCGLLVTGKLNAGEWHWTPDNARSACRVGIFLPSGPGADPLPNYTRCLNQIFQPMIIGCIYQGPYKVATVNLAALPDVSKNFSGRAVNAGYPSYVVSPKALYPSNYPAATANVYGDPVSGVESANIKNYTAIPGFPNWDWDVVNSIMRDLAIAASNGTGST